MPRSWEDAAGARPNSWGPASVAWIIEIPKETSKSEFSSEIDETGFEALPFSPPQLWDRMYSVDFEETSIKFHANFPPAWIQRSCEKKKKNFGKIYRKFKLRRNRILGIEWKLAIHHLDEYICEFWRDESFTPIFLARKLNLAKKRSGFWKNLSKN